MISLRQLGLSSDHWYVRFGAAISLIAAALLVRIVLEPWLDGHLPFITLYPALAAIAWYVGTAPAMVGAVLSMLAAHYFLLGPRLSFEPNEAPLVLLYAGYLAGAGLIVAVCAMARRRVAQIETLAEERRHLAEALEHTQSSLQAVLDTVPTVIYQLDTNGRYVYVNRRYAELLGVSTVEIKGKSLSDFFPPEVAESFMENNRAVMAAGETMAFEERAGMAEHARIYASVKTPLEDADGKSTGVLGISTDITQQKRVEEQLRENEARLRDADRRKDEFLAVLSHELRNPLAPILTAVQYLQLKGAVEAGLESGLTIIERQANVMARLVDDLLDLSRLSRGLIELRRERLDVAVAVEDALQTCRPLIDAARHQLSVNLPATPVHVDGDLVRLSQAVANLVNNAVKYTPPGGRIEVAVRETPDEVSIRVSDSGIGIPSDMLERIFEMFAQIEPGGERAQGGLGIGLTLAQQLAHMHGGRIDAESAGANRGSTFTMHLPLAGASAAERVELVHALPAAPPLRVLVADDNLDAARSLGLLLESQRHTVLLAHDGLEAVELVARFRPDLILLDIGMPRLNGYDAARRIRALPDGQRLRLVALTGWGQDEDRQQALNAGFDQHLTKPVDARTLQRVVLDAADV